MASHFSMFLFPGTSKPASVFKAVYGLLNGFEETLGELTNEFPYEVLFGLDVLEHI
jgi:hypothetical protein